jgi:O-antigen/teichoic acid export membrane protein
LNAAIPLPRGKFGQDVLWNMASLVVLGLCGILLNLVVAWFYNPSILGIFNEVYAVYMVFSQFAVAGIHLSVMKYVAEHSNHTERYRSIITAGLILSLGFAGTMSALFWLLREQIGLWMSSPGVADGIFWATPGLFFFATNKVLLAALNALSRMKSFAVFQALRYILLVVTFLVAAILNSPGEDLPVVFSATEIILFVCLLLVLRDEFCVPSFLTIGRWIVMHLAFGMRGFFSNVLVQLNTRVDVLVLGYFSSDYTVGIYSFAAILAEGMYQILTVLQINYNPILVQLISKRELGDLKTIIKKGVQLTYAAMLAIGIVTVLLYPLGLALLTNKRDFMQSWAIFAILMIGIMLSSGYVPFGNIMLQAGRPGLQTVMVAFLVLFNFVGNLLLVPGFGAIGSASATALSFVLSVFLVKGFTQSVLRIRI